MQTVYIGFAIRIWVYAGPPDTDVHNISGVYAEVGELFMNTNTLEMYICYQGGLNQLWSATTNTLAVQALMLQADWTQAVTTAKDYIKNKPTIPAAQIQSDWAQSINTSADYIKNKPSIPAPQSQSNWTQSNSSAVDFILNKPTIPAAQIQSNWTQANNTLSDYIQNKPTIPAAQIQSDWTQSTTSSLDYIKNKPTIPSAQIQSDWNQSNNSLLDYIKNKPSIPSAQIQSDWTQTNTGSIDFIKNKPANRSQSSASRTLNSVFQISTTRDCFANYSVDIATSLSLTTGQSGTVFLEIASDSGFTANVQELARFVNGNTGTLTIGLALSQNVTGTLSGYIPTGYYARLRTANNVGTPTFTYRSGQEVLS